MSSSEFSLRGSERLSKVRNGSKRFVFSEKKTPECFGRSTNFLKRSEKFEKVNKCSMRFGKLLEGSMKFHKKPQDSANSQKVHSVSIICFCWSCFVFRIIPPRSKKCVLLITLSFQKQEMFYPSLSPLLSEKKVFIFCFLH